MRYEKNYFDMFSIYRRNDCDDNHAQGKVSLGVKLNGNMTNLKFTKLKDKNNTFDPGVSFGGFAKIELSKHFVLQPELILGYTEGKIKIGSEKVKYEYSSVEVPIYAIGQIELGNGSFFFGIGPTIGYGFDSGDAKFKIGNSSYFDDFFDRDSDDNFKLGLNHWYHGGGGIVGYELHNGLTFHAGYQGTRDFHSERKKKKKMETHTISVGVGYKF